MRILIFLLPLIALASEFSDVIRGVDHMDLLEAKRLEVLANKKLYQASKGQNLPTIDMKLSAARLKETPTMYLHLPNMPLSAFPMGKRKQIRGEVSLRYPIFSGFAISSVIQKSRLNYLRSTLEKRDLKRNLYMQAASLYASLYATNQQLQALQKGYEALKLAYKKAKGFYEQELVPLSEVYNIEAKMYEMKAQMTKVKAQAKQLQNMLHYLSKETPKALALPAMQDVKEGDLLQRADIAMLRETLAIAKSDIALAKSKFLPTIALEASLKRFGDSLALNGDGYRNADESYIGVGVQYNIFSGFGDKYRLEAAKRAYMAKRSFYSDYVQKAKVQLQNAKVELEALRARIAWAKKQLVAAKEYAKLTKGRFNNQLASADELSRAIAKEAEAKAALEAVKAQIFAKKSQIALMIGLDSFKEALQ